MNDYEISARHKQTAPNLHVTNLSCLSAFSRKQLTLYSLLFIKSNHYKNPPYPYLLYTQSPDFYFLKN